MIYDNIVNISFYLGLSDDIREGLLFLKDVKPEIETGEYVLTPTVKAIVSEYRTKPEYENRFEAHRVYIDIQYLVYGNERIQYLPLDDLVELIPYSTDSDMSFYLGGAAPVDLHLGHGFFTILYPQDGHKPQVAITEPEKVKKIVIKVRI